MSNAASKFLFHNIGPFAGLTDGTAFMGIENIFIASVIKKQILSCLQKRNFPAEVIYELEEVPLGTDGLYCLSNMKTRIVEGYYVIECKDKREFSLSTAKEVYLDGHRFDVHLALPYRIKEEGDTVDEYGIQCTYHRKFDTLEQALQYIAAAGASERESSFEGETDYAVKNGEIICRRYIHREYRIGDLGKSIGEIPKEVLSMSLSEIKDWSISILERARHYEPNVHWYMGTTPLEMRVHRAMSTE